MSKIEVVMVGDQNYAIRKTTNFLFFKRRVFFDLKTSGMHWWPYRDKYFKDCISTDLSLVKGKFADLMSMSKKVTVINVSDVGTEPHALMLGMLRLAKTDPGMNDLIEKAKSYYYLKTK